MQETKHPDQTPPAWINTAPIPEPPEWLDQQNDLDWDEQAGTLTAAPEIEESLAGQTADISEPPRLEGQQPLFAADEMVEQNEPQKEKPKQEAVATNGQPTANVAPVRYEQIVIEFDRERSQEKAKGDESRNESPPPPRAAGERHETGDIDLGYSFVHFNQRGDYELVQRPAFAAVRHPLQTIFRAINGHEAEYQHKRDHSLITIRNNKIIIDNTEDNIHASLDIAQDKGWDVIKITGGSKAAKAEMWYHAQLRGFETTGYEPSEQDKKRLLGAQERQKEAQKEKSESLAQALDIRPLPELGQEPVPQHGQQATQPAEPAVATVPQDVRNEPVVPAEAKGKAAIQEQPGSEVQAEKNDMPDVLSPEHLSQAEIFSQARKDILSQVEKVVPLDEKEYGDIEAAIDKHIALAMRQGKSLNIKELKEDLRNSAPIVRDELEKAAHNEQRHSQEDRARTRNSHRERQPESSIPERRERGGHER